MRFAQTFAATLLAGMTLASVAHANLVTNGSFESSNATTDKLVFQNNVTGWGGGAKLTYISPPGTADNGKYLSVYGPFPKTSPDGGNFVLADGDPNYSSAITQTISGLNIGQSYLLTFYQAAGQQAGFKGPTTEQWKVTFGGETQYSTLYTLPQGGVGNWQAQSMTFIATAATQLLSFLAVGTPGGAPPISFLDGVNLEATSVPEPASLALFGSGIVGLCLARRRCRAQAA